MILRKRKIQCYFFIKTTLNVFFKLQFVMILSMRGCGALLFILPGNAGNTVAWVGGIV